MCIFIAQHNTKDVVQLACLLQECPPELLFVLSVVHFTTTSRLQRHFWELGSTFNWLHKRRPCVTTPAQDLHIQFHLEDRLRSAPWTADATVGLYNQRISAQNVRNHLREAHLHARCAHQGLDLTAVHHRNRLEWTNAHPWWFPVFTVPGRWQTCGWAVSQCQCCEQSAPWWWWGYGMGRHKLRTTNTGAFYWWQFESTEIPWQDPEAHCCAIHPPPSPHVATW